MTRDEESAAESEGEATGAPVETLPVKALGGGDEGAWELDVLGAPFGGPNNGRDLDGEFFTAETKFHEDHFALPPVVYYHGYDPDTGKPAGSPQYIGKTTARTVKEDGVWYRVALDKASALARRVWEAAKNGVARASSGSNHLSRVAQDGRILEWPVFELSVFDAVGNRRPSNAYAVALPVTKALYEAAGLPLPLELAGPSTAEAEGSPSGEQRAAGSVPPDDFIHLSQGEQIVTQTKEELLALLDERDATKAAQAAQAAQAKADEETRIKAAVDAALAAKEEELAKARRLPYGEFGGAPTVAKFGELRKYDNLAPGDAAVAAGILMAAKAQAKSRNGASEALLRALAIKMAEDTSAEGDSNRMALKAAGLSIKANELNQSTLANYGDEWVTQAFSSTMWDRIRLDTPIVGLLPTVEIPDGVESIKFPIEANDPTFYKIAQASAQDTNTLGRATPTIPSSKQGTGQREITVGKLGGRVLWSTELEEDSLVPWAAELRRSLEKEAAEVIEHVILDGDTATGATTNINHIGGTPSGTEAFLVLDGIRKLALVTNTANSRATGATLGVESYLETVKLMGLGGVNAVKRSDLIFVTDVHTYWATLNLPDIKTQDVWASPTLQNGELTSLWGRRLIPSANMHRANQDATYGLKANTVGKVNLTMASLNTTGSILAFNPSQWRLGWKRRIKFETDRIIHSDASELVVTMRLGLAYRDTEAAAISYGVPLA